MKCAAKTQAQLAEAKAAELNQRQGAEEAAHQADDNEKEILVLLGTAVSGFSTSKDQQARGRGKRFLGHINAC